jgi:hypothetical protein
LAPPAAASFLIARIASLVVVDPPVAIAIVAREVEAGVLEGQREVARAFLIGQDLVPLRPRKVDRAQDPRVREREGPSRDLQEVPARVRRVPAGPEQEPIVIGVVVAGREVMEGDATLERPRVQRPGLARGTVVDRELCGR